MSKTYILADYMTPDEGEQGKWDIVAGYNEEQAKKRIDMFMENTLGKIRVYEFEDGQIREVDINDLSKYRIEVSNLTPDKRLGGVLANDDPTELKLQETQYWGEPDVTRDAYDYETKG